jgi:hypothetical protein
MALMIYTPQKDPDQAMMLIAVVAFVGILGGLFVHEFIMLVALIFWLQYTAILSYLQFRHHHRHRWRGFTEALLHPQVRFFVFSFLAATGIFAILVRDNTYVGAVVLFAWLLFSVNFYRYYALYRKYE